MGEVVRNFREYDIWKNGISIVKRVYQITKEYVLVDIEYDEKAGKELYEIGMEMLAIVKALKYTAEFYKEGKKKASKKSDGDNLG